MERKRKSYIFAAEWMAVRNVDENEKRAQLNFSLSAADRIGR